MLFNSTSFNLLGEGRKIDYNKLIHYKNNKNMKKEQELTHHKAQDALIDIIYSDKIFNDKESFLVEISNLWMVFQSMESEKLKVFLNGAGFDETLFEQSLKNGSWFIANKLLELGVDPNVLSNERTAWTYFARGFDSIEREKNHIEHLFSNDNDNFLKLIEKLAPVVPAQDPKGWGSIQNIVALKNENLIIPSLCILLKAGHDINSIDNIGESGFLISCWKAHSEVVQWFVDHGANIEAKTVGGFDAWKMALRRIDDLFLKEDDEIKNIKKIIQTLDVLKNTKLNNETLLRIIDPKKNNNSSLHPLLLKWVYERNLEMPQKESFKSKIRL